MASNRRKIDDGGMKTFFAVPYSLIPVYVVLLLQFVGVVWYTSGLFQKVAYQTEAIQALQAEVKKMVEDGLPNRYTVVDAQREFQKRDDNLNSYIASHKAEVERHLLTLEDLKLRVRELEIKQKR